MSVPQGIILGPFLIIIYIICLLVLLEKDYMLFYVYKTGILSLDETWEKAETKVNYYLDSVNAWLRVNKWSSNFSKVVYLTFGLYINSASLYA